MSKKLTGVSFHYEDQSSVSYWDNRGGDGDFLRATMDVSGSILDKTIVQEPAVKAALTRAANYFFGSK